MIPGPFFFRDNAMSSLRKLQLTKPNRIDAAVKSPAPARVKAEPIASSDPIATAMDQAAASVPRLLTPEAVADMLGVTERTLERWRMTGEGPKFCKLSRSTVRYQPNDIAAFVADRLRANTAQ
jgi:predicted DNA-binding transcriptional regulator AlpA